MSEVLARCLRLLGRRGGRGEVPPELSGTISDLDRSSGHSDGEVLTVTRDDLDRGDCNVLASGVCRWVSWTHVCL